MEMEGLHFPVNITVMLWDGYEVWLPEKELESDQT